MAKKYHKKRKLGNEYLPPIVQTSIVASVDTKVLLAAKVIEDKSKHFHSYDKGCDLEGRIIYSIHSRKNIAVIYCTTHDAICCNCGWEFNYHYGTESLLLRDSGKDGCYVPHSVIINCKRCGNPTKANTKNRKYCSSCSEIVRREQTKNYILSHPKQKKDELDIPENLHQEN